MENPMLFTTGEKVTPGVYVCAMCEDYNNAQTIIVQEKDEGLPECPVCGATQWYRTNL